MPFCSNCGKELKEQVKFCPSCGKKQAEPENKTDFTSADDKTAGFDYIDISQNKIFAVLAYIGPLVLVPILAAPNSKFARFHANQGLVLFICDIFFFL